MKVLITAGPTREYIDDVRFISNPSSGVVGMSLAKEALRRGFEVAVVLGPTSLPPIYGVKVIPVLSADDMIEKTLAELDFGYDLLISAAAISDYKPVKKQRGKIRSGRDLTITFKPTRKLIHEVRRTHPEVKIVAFKAEYDKTAKELIEAARRMLNNADLVVANDVSKGVFGTDKIEAYIVSDKVEHVKKTSKLKAAKRIFDKIAQMFT